MSTHSKSRNYVNPFRVPAFVVAFCVVLFIVASVAAGIKVMTHTTPVSQTISMVPQPPSAAQVAKSVNCVKFTHLPVQAGQGFGTVDAGSCWIGSAKYAINTFPTAAVRDSWLKLAEPLGVNPKWETSTAVIYPSVSSS